MLAARIDYHVHESYSSDARGSTVPRVVEAAEGMGLEELAFTTHFIVEGPESYFGVQPDQLGDYVENIRRHDEETPVRLRVGLEVDYFPGAEGRLERLLEEHPLDFVLGSLHFIEGLDIGHSRQAPLFFQGLTLREATSKYHRLWRRAVESGLFDAMAHPDYWRRYLSGAGIAEVDIDDYGGLQEALDSLREYGVGFEVNSSGFRHEHGVQYPLLGFIEAARERGVSTVTLGSDCHTPLQLGFAIPRAVEQLRAAGYTHFTVFQGRRPSKRPLEEAVGRLINGGA